jgi:thiol:disulfide interchange protein DsbC
VRNPTSRRRALGIGALAAGAWAAGTWAWAADQHAPGTADATPPALRAIWPSIGPDAARPAPVAGWLEVVLPDGQLAYLDPQQRYLLLGRLVDLWTRRDLSAERLERERGAVVQRIPEADVLWIAPEGPERGRLYVFDDPDCPFCRQAHPVLAELAARGVAVGVLLYPVVRLHPAAYGKSVAIWCAADRRAALDRAMRGDAVAVPEAGCAHPVDRNLVLGRLAGVTGTPFWLAASGRALAGARSLDELLQLAGVREEGPGARREPAPQN